MLQCAAAPVSLNAPPPHGRQCGNAGEFRRRFLAARSDGVASERGFNPARRSVASCTDALDRLAAPPLYPRDLGVGDGRIPKALSSWRGGVAQLVRAEES